MGRGSSIVASTNRSGAWTIRAATSVLEVTVVPNLRGLYRGRPQFPLMIVGYGRFDHAHVPASLRKQLIKLAASDTAHWGLLFVLDARRHRWTLFSPDAEYAALFAPAAHTLNLDVDVFTTKFPCWSSGWRIT